MFLETLTPVATRKVTDDESILISSTVVSGHTHIFLDLILFRRPYAMFLYQKKNTIEVDS